MAFLYILNIMYWKHLVAYLRFSESNQHVEVAKSFWIQRFSATTKTVAVGFVDSLPIANWRGNLYVRVKKNMYFSEVFSSFFSLSYFSFFFSLSLSFFPSLSFSHGPYLD